MIIIACTIKVILILFTLTNFMTMNFAPTDFSSAAVLRWSTSATGMQESLLTMRWISYSWPTCGSGSREMYTHLTTSYYPFPLPMDS